MKIVEICNTIHGELPNIGAACLLIRLAKCNLECPYCDADFDKEATELSPKQFQETVLSSPHRHVLITGGEPLLQGPELLEALVPVTARGTKALTLETNGSVVIPVETFRHFRSVVMDLKLFKYPSFSIEQRNLKTMSQLEGNHAVKMVVDSDEDWALAWQLVSEMPRNFKPMIIFSPTTSYRESSNMDTFEAYSQMHPNLDLRLQVQIHKLLGVA